MNRRPDDTYFIVRCILEQGNKPGLIAQWFDGLRRWADANPGQDAAALRLWLDMIKPRPFYTAGELAGFWPALKMTLGITKRLDAMPSANRLHNELVFCGLPQLNGGLAPFGRYFIVEHVHRWRKARLNQEEFENVLYGRTS